MIAVVDYKIGNIHSLLNALAYLGCAAKVTRDPEKLLAADKIILPGVGAFDAAMRNLNEFALVDVLNEAALKQRKPILGICIGMQIMAETGEENGRTVGLGWFAGAVRPIAPLMPGTRVPHVGFNDVSFVPNCCGPFAVFKEPTDFYFVHGYHMECANPADAVGTVDYGGRELTAAVARDNIAGVQFHPEKSQSNGLAVLNAFLQA